MRHDLRNALVACAACCLAACATAPARPQHTREAQQLVFPSGFTVVVDPDNSRPLVAVVSEVRAGATADPEGKEGLAHFVEHLTFRSRHDGKLELSTQLTRAGVATWNAATKLDTTEYQTLGPTTALVSMLRLEGARLANPITGVDDATFDVERGVVKNELHTRDESGRMAPITQNIFSSLFPAPHPYAHFGRDSSASMQAITRADVESFVALHYRPAAMTLVIAGDVQLKGLRALVVANLPSQLLQGTADKTAVLPPPPLPTPAPALELPTLHAPVKQPTIAVAWALPPFRGRGGLAVQMTADYFRGFIGPATLLNGRDASVLLHQHVLDGTGTPEAQALAYLKSLDGRWPQINFRQMRYMDKNFDPIRTAILAQDARQMETLLARAERRAEGSALKHDPSLLQDSDQLDFVRFSDLVQLQGAFLPAGRARAVLVLPEVSAELESPADATVGTFASEDAARLRYTNDAAGLLLNASPVTNAVSYVMANGMEVTVVPQPHTNLVAVALALPGGHLGAGKNAAGAFAPGVLLEPHHGTPGDVGADFHYQLGPDYSVLTYAGMGGNVSTLMAMLGERLEQTSMTPQRFASLAPKYVQLLQAEEKRPSLRIERALIDAIFQNPERGHAAYAAELAQVHVDDVQDFLRRTYVPDRARLVVVGDVEPSDVFTAARLEIGDWKHAESRKQKPAALVARPLPAAHARFQNLYLAGNHGSQSLLALGCALPTVTPRQRWSAQLLEIVLREELEHFARNTLGATYGVNSVLERRLEGDSVLALSTLVQNASLGAVAARARATWASLGKNPVGEDRLHQAKWELARISNASAATSLALASRLALTRLAGEPAQAVLPTPAELNALSEQDLLEEAAACGRTATLAVQGKPAALEPLERTNPPLTMR